MTTITMWTHDQQLEMLQLIKYSYEMTAACLGGEHIKDWLFMHYGNFENMPYVSSIKDKDFVNGVLIFVFEILMTRYILTFFNLA